MAAENIRVGRVSSIDYNKGMIKVVYADKDNAVTKDLPFLSMNGEYKMPNIGDMVLVLHLSNGASMGIIVGTFWSNSNKPAETGKGVYRKELGMLPGEAYLRYDSNTKELTIKADTVKVQTNLNTTIM
jgi:phage baseplate assembly protein gpV